MIPTELKLKIGPQIHINSLDSIINHLKDVFQDRITSTSLERLKKMPRKCYASQRKQYDAHCLLINYKEQNKLVLVLIKPDIYAKHLNFVFGIATFGRGAIVSCNRLENDIDFLKKELIHELGHVFGLQHCKLPCVMTFSNSVYEAKQKSSEFCDKCQKQLHQHSI